MKLFNKYKNQVFLYLTNYINSCENDPAAALNELEFREHLQNIMLNSSEKLIDAITNSTVDEDIDSLNANLFYKDPEGLIQPIISNNVPVLTSFAERAWLYYVLSDPKSELFLDKATIDALKSNINFNDDAPNPFTDDTIDIRYLSGQKPRFYTSAEKDNFKLILKAITEHRYITLSNTTEDGTTLKNENAVPFRLEYNVWSDYFSISIWDTAQRRPIKMLFDNLSEITLGTKIKDYFKIRDEYETALLSRKNNEPLKLIINDYNNGFDRASFILSPYERVSYRNENNEINMELYYYTFQENELLTNLLFLGKAVKIVYPESFKQKYLDKIKHSLENYS